MEIPCDAEIQSNHDSVVAVSKYMKQNRDFAKKYEYTVEFRPGEGTNIIAQFRLKKNLRRGNLGSKGQKQMPTGQSQSSFQANNLRQPSVSNSENQRVGGGSQKGLEHKGEQEEYR